MDSTILKSRTALLTSYKHIFFFLEINSPINDMVIAGLYNIPFLEGDRNRTDPIESWGC